MRTIRQIVVLIGMLCYVGTAYGIVPTTRHNHDTLSAEEKQQFLYYYYEAQRQIQQEAVLPAWELMQFCYELNPNDAAVNNYMGVFLNAFEKPNEALPYLQRAFELEPSEYWYHYTLQLIRSGSDKQEKAAIRYLEYVATILPKDENLHAMLQKAYIHVRDFQQALLLQDKIDSIAGYNAMSALQRYRLNIVLDKPQQAIYEVERYLEEEPDNVQFQAFRLELYEKTGQPSDKMIEAYMAILPYDSQNMVLKNNLAWHLCITGRDLEYAEELSRATIMAEPSNPVFLDTYAWIMYLQGKYYDAHFYIQRALENATPEVRKEIIAHYKAILKKL